MGVFILHTASYHPTNRQENSLEVKTAFLQAKKIKSLKCSVFVHPSKATHKTYMETKKMHLQPCRCQSILAPEIQRTCLTWNKDYLNGH